MFNFRFLTVWLYISAMGSVGQLDFNNIAVGIALLFSLEAEIGVFHVFKPQSWNSEFQFHIGRSASEEVVIN